MKSLTHPKNFFLLLCLATILILGFVIFQNKSVFMTTPSPSPVAFTPPSDWKTYSIPEIGFSFKYPPDVIWTQKQESSQIQLWTSATKLDALTDDAWFSRSFAEKDLRQLQVGQYGEETGMAKNYLKQVISVQGVNMKKYLTLAGLSCTDVYFTRMVYFYKGDYLMMIGLIGPRRVIQAENPSYFAVNQDCDPGASVWRDDKVAQFAQDVSSGKLSGAAKEWYQTFDQILSTFQFTE